MGIGDIDGYPGLSTPYSAECQPTKNVGASLRDLRDIFLTSRASETMSLGSLIDRWTSLAFASLQSPPSKDVTMEAF